MAAAMHTNKQQRKNGQVEERLPQEEQDE